MLLLFKIFITLINSIIILYQKHIDILQQRYILSFTGSLYLGISILYQFPLQCKQESKNIFPFAYFNPIVCFSLILFIEKILNDGDEDGE